MLTNNKYRLGGLAALPLGMVFVIAGIGKLLLVGQGTTPPSFVPQALFTSLPYIELIIGGLLIFGVAIKLVASLSILLIAGFAISNILMIELGVSGCVNCFGAWGSFAPTAVLILDGIMAVLVMVILFCYRGGFFSIKPWFLEELKTEKEVSGGSESKLAF